MSFKIIVSPQGKIVNSGAYTLPIDSIKENNIISIDTNNNNKVVLLTSFFECNNSNKYSEWVYSLEKNITDNNIQKIVLFLEGFSNIVDITQFRDHFAISDVSKLSLIKIDSRPSFYYLINYANIYFNNRTIVITNSDIFFENLNIVSNIDMTKVIFALTRYSYTIDRELSLPSFKSSCYPSEKYNITDFLKVSNVQPCYNNKYLNSQLNCYYEEKVYANEYCADAWIFKTPMGLEESFKHIFLGKFRCDNNLNKLFTDKVNNEGYIFENPCLTIKAIHYDFNTVREFDNNEECVFHEIPTDQLFIQWSYISDNFSLVLDNNLNT
jgi:hypothetical protein